ncbi:MAG: hypothetical protein HY753_00045 [Nitrospirae bacterium]|nr:hypothetical protein [Nitrospirota bacterium]
MKRLSGVRDKAVAIVSSLTESLLKQYAKADDGKWIADQHGQHLMVFHLTKGEVEKFKHFQTLGYKTLPNHLCENVLPGDSKVISEYSQRFKARNGRYAAILIDRGFILCLRQKEHWNSIAKKLRKLFFEQHVKPLKDDHNKECELLQSLIDSSSRKEKECRDFVRRYPELLLPPNGNIVDPHIWAEIEQDTHTGRYDLLIITETKQHGKIEKEAYIWELKAPQLYIFEILKGKHARVRKELVEAENQLFHYYSHLKTTGKILSEIDVKPENVKFGGIIIGCEHRFVLYNKGKINSNKALSYAESARHLREKHFYQPNGIQLLTWDNVLCQFKNSTAK